MNKNRKQFYMALDLATIQTGWAIGGILNNQLVQLMKGSISLDKDLPLPVRLRKLRTHILHRARNTPLEPILFKETPVHDTYNRKISSAIFKAHGVIEVEFSTYRIVDVNPVSVKKHMTGNGHSSKQQVQDGVINRLDLPLEFTFSNYDESDAVGILLTGLSELGLIEERSPSSIKGIVKRTSVANATSFSSIR